MPTPMSKFGELAKQAGFEDTDAGVEAYLASLAEKPVAEQERVLAELLAAEE